MKIWAIDTETHLFGPSLMAPPVVCLTWATNDESGIYVGDDILNVMVSLLVEAAAERLKIIGHNIAYDMACLMASYPRLIPLIWKAYDAGGIVCTQVREALIGIAAGDLKWRRFGRGKVEKRQFTLAAMTKHYLGIELEKDEWRTGYEALDGVPLSEWPQGAIDYAIGDAVATLRVWEQQEKIGHSPDEANQVRAAMALHLVGVWGMRADKEKTEAMHVKVGERMEEIKEGLAEAGIVRKNGSKNMEKIRELIILTHRGIPGLTPKKAIQTDKKNLEQCDHPALKSLVEYNALQKTNSTYITALLRGIYEPIHAWFHVLGAVSGRTSCSNPNLQNQPRLPGIRECYAPSREGWVFVACDYDSQELRALAQVCLDILGESALARRYMEDPSFDPHTHFAVQVMGISYEEGLRRLKLGKSHPHKHQCSDCDTRRYMKDMRQQAKAANFGFPGGMGAEAFMDYARGYGVTLEIDEAEALRDAWFEQWPEMRRYFDYIKSVVGRMNCGDIVQLRSERLRGACGYTDGANTYFQGLSADSSKLAMYVTMRECHNPDSPLFGYHPVNFIHDEIMLEGPEEGAHAAAVELSRIMGEAMAKFTPDIPTSASATIMRWWSKDAEPTYNDQGQMVPWAGGLAA